MADLEFYTDEQGERRWRVRADNGEIVIPPEGHRDDVDVGRAVEDAYSAFTEARGHAVKSLP